MLSVNRIFSILTRRIPCEKIKSSNLSWNDSFAYGRFKAQTSAVGEMTNVNVKEVCITILFAHLFRSHRVIIQKGKYNARMIERK